MLSDAQLDVDDARRAVRVFLAKHLPPRQVLIIELLSGLIDGEERSYAQVAELTGTTENGVHWARQEAGKVLRGYPEFRELLRATVRRERVMGRIHTHEAESNG